MHHPWHMCMLSLVLLCVTPTFAQDPAGIQQDVPPPQTAVNPNPENRYNVPIPSNPTVLVDVFGAAQNVGQADTAQHRYLYAPPLLFVTDASGTLKLRYEEDQAGASVTFFLQGVDDTLRNAIARHLQTYENIAVKPEQVLPLQLSFLEVSPTSSAYNWRVQIPERTTDAVSLQREFPIRVAFPSTQEALAFQEHLLAGIDMTLRFGYSGYTLHTNRRELRTSALRDAGFINALQGPAGSQYVTRDQIRRALAYSAQRLDDRWYLENPSLGLEALQWFENSWEQRRVSWEEFLTSYATEVSRYGFNQNDLTPDRLTTFLDKLREEYENESKEVLEVDGEYEAEANFLDVIGGRSGGKLNVKRDDFERLRTLSDSHVEWTGEAFYPKSIEVFVLNEEALSRDEILVSTITTARRSDRIINRSAHSSQTTFAGTIPGTCNANAGTITIDDERSLEILLQTNPELRRDAAFPTELEYFAWLSRKPMLEINAPLVVRPGTTEVLHSCEVRIGEGGEIRILDNASVAVVTLLYTDNGNGVQGVPVDSSSAGPPETPPTAGKGSPDHPTGGSEGGGISNRNGGPGGSGMDGYEGAQGGNGGAFMLIALAVQEPLTVVLPGGSGGPGGRGGNGGPGGNGHGAKGGSAGFSVDFFGAAVGDCRASGSPGGTGGTGGIAGRGGPGGAAGSGGTIVFHIGTELPSESVLSAPAGQPGPGGPPGTGGPGGRGGDSHGGDRPCPSQRGGSAGPAGAPNVQGPQGLDGNAGMVDVNVVTGSDSVPNYTALFVRAQSLFGQVAGE